MTNQKSLSKSELLNLCKVIRLQATLKLLDYSHSGDTYNDGAFTTINEVIKALEGDPDMLIRQAGKVTMEEMEDIILERESERTQ